MLCAEYDYDMDMVVQKEESYQDGFSDGVINVARNLLKNGTDRRAFL